MDVKSGYSYVTFLGSETVEIVRMASTKIELSPPSTYGTATTVITDPEVAIGTVASRRGGTVDLNAKED